MALFSYAYILPPSALYKPFKLLPTPHGQKPELFEGLGIPIPRPIRIMHLLPLRFSSPFPRLLYITSPNQQTFSLSIVHWPMALSKEPRFDFATGQKGITVTVLRCYCSVFLRFQQGQRDTDTGNSKVNFALSFYYLLLPVFFLVIYSN